MTKNAFMFSVKPLEKALSALHEAIERSRKEADDVVYQACLPFYDDAMTLLKKL